MGEGVGGRHIHLAAICVVQVNLLYNLMTFVHAMSLSITVLFLLVFIICNII